MVRLKASPPAEDDADLPRFNSTMVRLKGIGVETLGKSVKSFNSTMVRLKAETQERDAPVFILFQFHNGSIKRVDRVLETIEEELFQFHNGSIKSGLSYTNRFEIPLFQFHNGSIKSKRRDNKAQAARRVSIPQWFD